MTELDDDVDVDVTVNELLKLKKTNEIKTDLIVDNDGPIPSLATEAVIEDVNNVNVIASSPISNQEPFTEMTLILPIEEEMDLPIKLLMTEIKIPEEIYKDFSFLMDTKYNNDPDLKEKKIQSEINFLFKIGLNEMKKNINTTSSSTLHYRGKPPRKDVMVNFAKIAYILKNQHNFYPNFKPLQISTLITKAIGNKDARTLKSHLDSVLDASIANNLHGVINVESFVSQIPWKVFDKVQKELDSRWI